MIRLFLFLCTFGITLAAVPPPRGIPAPLPDHPGNIFLHDELELAILVPNDLPSGALSWRLLNDRELAIFAGTLPASPQARLSLPSPGIGWYRLEFLDQTGNRVASTAAAVVARLQSPTPFDSPICLDAAISWFARDDHAQQTRFANLAALAGVNWVRDRLRWRDLQPEPDRFSVNTNYDTAAAIQHRAGLQVLQVFHDTPPWARRPNAPGGRFPDDLRVIHQFASAMARRFHGRVQAWEPWNEANVASFGAHTVDEMCSWQKAAWLGFKSVDPQLIVGWNPTAAVPTPQHTEGLRANETHAFFDTYNIHTYDWFHDYDRLWTPALAAAAAKPLWITEADRGMKHINNSPDFDLPWPGERLKAEALVQEFALSLAAGAAQHFHFILGHYHEPNGVQFGLLRHDLTPRPAYVALATIGRLLAGAQFLGHWQPGDGVHVVAFHARPDGHERDVVVLWAENPVDWDARGQHTAPNPLPMEMEILAIHDYLGRRASTGLQEQIGSAPQFLTMPRGASKQLPLENHLPVPPPPSTTSLGTVSTLILQILWPGDKRTSVTDLPWSEGQVYTFKPGEAVPLQIAIYNFGDQPAEGTLAAESLPPDWSLDFPKHAIHLAPGERQIMEAKFTAPPAAERSSSGDWIRVRGDFPSHPSPVVAFRCLADKEP